MHLRPMMRRTTTAGKTSSITVPIGRRICVHTNNVVYLLPFCGHVHYSDAYNYGNQLPLTLELAQKL